MTQTTDGKNPQDDSNKNILGTLAGGLQDLGSFFGIGNSQQEEEDLAAAEAAAKAAAAKKAAELKAKRQKETTLLNTSLNVLNEGSNPGIFKLNLDDTTGLLGMLGITSLSDAETKAQSTSILRRAQEIRQRKMSPGRAQTVLTGSNNLLG